MNEHAPWFSVFIGWAGAIGVISWNQALGLACAICSIVASYYAIRVSRARLKKLEDAEDQ